MTKKPGRKPEGDKPKVKVNYTIDADLLTEIDKRTNNRSGFLNTAGWEKIKRDKKKDKAKGAQP